MDNLSCTSILICGHDINGEPVGLGDVDSDGRPVGYIDASGLAWESLTEAQTAVACGRLFDAQQQFRKGLRAVAPVPAFFAARYAPDCDQQAVLAEMAEQDEISRMCRLLPAV